MSKQYPGGIITKSPATPTGPYESGTAPGIWTLEQQMQYKQQGIWPTAGNVPNYIEDVFSTWVYTGTGAARTITNGIDLSTKGGLVWTKDRKSFTAHNLVNTVSGNTKYLISNSDSQEQTTSPADNITSFNVDGYSLGADTATNQVNYLNETYVSWTFRKQPKFFDVVTYTGTGTTNVVAHSLASVPGAIFIKRTSSAADWRCLCKNGTNYSFLTLNAIDGDGGTPVAINLCATSTTLDIGYIGAAGGNTPVNTNGETYVAYIFAHDAGGFGLTGTDNVISCGSYVGNGSATGPVVTLGYEPQWLIIKSVGSSGGNWTMFDNMRGLTAGDGDAFLFANTSAAESTSATRVGPSATGFYLKTVAASLNASGVTYIYIAIRRGPMKVPTLGTSVFSPIAYNGTGTSTINTLSTNFPVDFYLQRSRSVATDTNSGSRLTGGSTYLNTNLTDAEWNLGSGNGTNNTIGFASNIGLGLTGDWNNPSSPNYSPYILEAFRRAPSFFDEVCYTGTGTTLNVDHNLAVAPELIIIKKRSATGDWFTGFNFGASTYSYAKLNLSDAAASGGYGFAFGAQPTTTQFTPGSSAGVNGSGATYVAYLFATCAGVSKVGSYTGNGTTQTINCGFTSGARFVLIKQTDSSGGWFVYDTARGMTTLTDPYLYLNSTAAETATLGSVTTVSTGFALNAALANVNINGGSYIFLAIA
jgi:hypothetical protein